MKAYQSPISLEIDIERIADEIITNRDEAIVKYVNKIGVTVEKDELIKALKYDREQYEKGYADGRRSAERSFGRCTEESRYFHCSECGYGVMDVYEGNYSKKNEVLVFEKGHEWKFCPNCGAEMT